MIDPSIADLLLSLGLFANGSYGDGFNGFPGKVTGLFFGNSAQFFAECIGVAVNVSYVGGIPSGVAETVLG